MGIKFVSDTLTEITNDKNKMNARSIISKVLENCANHLYSLECYDEFPDDYDTVKDTIKTAQTVLRSLSKQVKDDRI